MIVCVANEHLDQLFLWIILSKREREIQQRWSTASRYQCYQHNVSRDDVHRWDVCCSDLSTCVVSRESCDDSIRGANVIFVDVNAVTHIIIYWKSTQSSRLNKQGLIWHWERTFMKMNSSVCLSNLTTHFSLCQMRSSGEVVEVVGGEGAVFFFLYYASMRSWCERVSRWLIGNEAWWGSIESSFNCSRSILMRRKVKPFDSLTLTKYRGLSSVKK